MPINLLRSDLPVNILHNLQAVFRSMTGRLLQKERMPRATRVDREGICSEEIIVLAEQGATEKIHCTGLAWTMQNVPVLVSLRPLQNVLIHTASAGQQPWLKRSSPLREIAIQNVPVPTVFAERRPPDLQIRHDPARQVIAAPPAKNHSATAHMYARHHTAPTLHRALARADHTLHTTFSQGTSPS